MNNPVRLENDLQKIKEGGIKKEEEYSKICDKNDKIMLQEKGHTIQIGRTVFTLS